MPDTFVPLLGRAEVLTAAFTRTGPSGPPAAATDVRRFEVDITTRTRPTSAAFDVSGGAAIPDALLRAAREEADNEGRAAGYAAGLEAARRASEQDLADAAAARDVAAQRAAAEVAAALQALRVAAGRLDAQMASVTEALAEQTLAAVVSLTTAVLGHALARGEDTALDAVRRALDPLPGTGPVVVRLCPTDADIVARANASAGNDKIDTGPRQRPLSVVADPTLDRGDAVACSGVTEVDARLGTALERALRALRS